MYEENIKRILIKLINALRDNKDHARKNVTLFLGAGCSLTSSKQDISTYGIIKSLVQKYSIDHEPIPKEWTELYQKFVNNIWHGQGETDKKFLLQDYFQDMKPSIGYQKVRYLLENGYVNNIITTNFDPMLDFVLDGLSYNLQVGTKKEIIGNSPNFVLLKAHGDLDKGQLRFAPSELYKLPDEIANTIYQLTSGTVIIVGYRGQDMGIIQALNDSEEHSAYWITYEQPDLENAYEYDPIINWLKKRNSEMNLLYGAKYGEFDKVFSIISEIIDNKKVEIIQEDHLLWQKSYLNDFFKLNKRFQNIFDCMLAILNELEKRKIWTAHPLYYAESHRKLLALIIDILNNKILPSDKLQCITNEIDSLIFCVSVEIWCLCQGVSIGSDKMTDYLQREYSKNPDAPGISQTFWSTIKWISGLNIQETPECPSSFCEIMFSFDSGNNYQAVINRVSLQEFSDIFLTIQCILVFLKTSNNTAENIVNLNVKKMLENYMDDIMLHDDIIDIHLKSMDQKDYREISRVFLAPYFRETIIGNRHFFYYNNILFINVKTEESSPYCSADIISSLNEFSNKMKENFMDMENVKWLINRKDSVVITQFLTSQKNGLFIIGESGIGKSSLLKKAVSEMPSDRIIVFPIVSKHITDISNWFKDILGIYFEKKENLEFLNVMLDQRKQILLFIFDAINELDAPLQQIITLYKKILNFCDYLFNKNLNNIKIIITSRTDFYEQLKYNINLEPSASSFFTNIDKCGILHTVYSLNRLSYKEAKKIFSFYGRSRNIDFNELLKEYGDVLYNPIYLNIINKGLAGYSGNNFLVDSYNIYQLWFDDIICKAQKDNISSNTIIEIADYIIANKYFPCTDNVLTSFGLFQKIHLKNTNNKNIFEWLKTHNVLKTITNSKDTVAFSHDKIEEYFLKVYIQKKYNYSLVKVLRDLDMCWEKSPIVLSAARALLQSLYQENKLYLNQILIEGISSNNDWIIHLICEFLIINKYNSTSSMLEMLKELEKYICIANFHKFIRVFYSVIEDRIDTLQYFDVQILEMMSHFIRHSQSQNLSLCCVLSNYNFAKYIWRFPIRDSRYDYIFAINLCNNNLKVNEMNLPQKIINKNKQLLSALLRMRGDLNTAVKLMNEVYVSLCKNACFDEACRIMLELGATYRELTLFDNSLKLYQNFDTNVLNDTSLKYRIYMNSGIIYKNKAQNDLFEKQSTEDTHRHYKKAKQLFIKVYNYTQTHTDIPLKLEILAELIECSVLGYYLDKEDVTEAETYAHEMDIVLPLYPVPIRQIQSCRMWARVYVVQGEIEKALQKLDEGFNIAEHYKISFRAADCCNQISDIVYDAINRGKVSSELLQKGITACEYSINYYNKLQKSNHRYLKDTMKKLQKLKQLSNNLC